MEKKRKKSPYRALRAIPITLIIDVAILIIAAVLQKRENDLIFEGAVASGQMAEFRSDYIFMAFIVCVLLTLTVTVVSIILTIVRASAQKKERQKAGV